MTTKKIDLTFKPGEGLGAVCFNFDKQDVIAICGTPDEEDEIKDQELKVIYFSYTQARIEFLFHYESDKFDYLTVFAPDVIMDGTNIASLTKDQITDFIKSYHIKNNIPYKSETSTADDVNEYYYQFENLGLTVWYGGEFVSEICLCSPDNLK